MNDLKFSKTFLINLLIVSIVPFLIWGPFFPDLIVVIVALFFLYYVIKNKIYYYFNNIALIIFFLFCIISVVSSMFANDIIFSLKSSLFYFRIGIFSCFIWYLIDKNKIILTYFYYTLILCFTALVIDGYYQYFNGENLFGLKLVVGTRVSSFFGDELIMGSYLSRLFPLLFALFLIKNKKASEIYFIGLLFILVDVLIYLSGERTAFFHLNLSTLFIIILIKDFKKFRLITFIIALVCVFIISLNSSQLTNRMIMEPLKNVGVIENSKESTIFSPVHDSMIKTAFNMFLDKPMLGHGPRMFRKICSEKKYTVGFLSCSTHPHNFYIQLLAETGIVGFSFLFILFCYIVYCSYKHLESILLKKERYLTDYQICLLACLLITTWPFAPSGNFFNNWLMIIYSLPIGFYLQSIYSKKINNTENE